VPRPCVPRRAPRATDGHSPETDHAAATDPWRLRRPAIGTVWPETIIQTCIVHLLRNVRREASVISIGGERPPTLGRRSGSVKLRAA
jgi:hypothetical protein